MPDTNLSAQNYQLAQHNTADGRLTDQQVSYTPTPLLESRRGLVWASGQIFANGAGTAAQPLGLFSVAITPKVTG